MRDHILDVLLGFKLPIYCRHRRGRKFLVGRFGQNLSPLLVDTANAGTGSAPSPAALSVPPGRNVGNISKPNGHNESISKSIALMRVLFQAAR